MSARALQRVVVRMLFDPQLLDAVYADPHTALADEDVSFQEKAWLVKADPRQWRADPHRQARSLQGLIRSFR